MGSPILIVSKCMGKTIRILRPNKNIHVSVFRVTGMKILGRVGTHIFLNYFFSGKNYNFMHFEKNFASQNA